MGPDYISEKLMKWAQKHGVTIQHIQPGLDLSRFRSAFLRAILAIKETGQPQQNACIKRHNRTVRHEWLDQYIIETIDEAQHHATQWL